MTLPVVEGYSGLEEIGAGGFATVYRARQDRLDRSVALKVLRAKDLDEATVRRFERECHAMGDLSWHPNVVGVFDSGVNAAGHPWLAMEYMARGSIADRMKRSGPLPWAEVLDIGVQVAGALGAVHAAGRIHRDVKPENLLIGPFGEVKLADFGIAVVSDSTSATAAQFTPGFVSTEVLQGASPDERSDMYSLGATLHALIAGHSPFATVKGEPVAALLMRAIQGERPRLEGVPDDLADLIVSSLDTDPARRPQTAMVFGEVLQGLQQAQGLPVTVLRITAEVDAVAPDTPSAAPQPGPDSAPTVVSGPALDAAPDASATIVGGLPTEDSSATIVGGLPTEDSSATIVGGLPTEDSSATIVGRLPEPAAVAPPAPAPPPPPVTPPPAPPIGAIDAPTAGKKGRTRLLIGVGVGLALLLVIVGAVVLLSGGGSDGGRDGGVVATIPVGDDVRGLAAGSDDLWVADADADVVARIDTGSNTVVDTVTVGDEPDGVARSGDDVWVTNAGDGTVSQVSASTGDVVATIPVGRSPRAIAATGDSVWVVNQGESSVSRIDARSGAVTEVAVDSPLSVAATDEGIWFGSLDGTVVEVDAGSGRVVQEVAVGSGGQIGAVAVTPSAVWALDLSNTSLRRIDPASGEELASFPLTGVPVALAPSGEEVLLTNLSEQVVQRFGPDGATAVYDAGELPEQIAVSESGRIYVSDRDQDAVLRIAPSD